MTHTNPDTLYFLIPASLVDTARSNSLRTFSTLYVAFKQQKLSPVASWLVRTAYELREEGLECCFTATPPNAGIMFGTSQTTPYLFKPPRELFYVHCVTDASGLHPYAQLNICQNPSHFAASPRSVFIPHWPHAAIIPRNPSLGVRVQNIAFYGDSANLASELRTAEWRTGLRELGFNWIIKLPEAWTDYSDTDVVVAIRSFDARHVALNKPASKLYNAWLAGVPALLGPESAYRAERRGPNDYIEVSNQQQIVESLLELRQNTELYSRMVETGRRRAEEVQPSVLRRKWLQLIQTQIRPGYARWITASPIERGTYFCCRYLQLHWNGVRARYARIRSWR